MRRLVQVEHFTLNATKEFVEVEVAPEASTPPLDPDIALRSLEPGAPRFIFLKQVEEDRTRAGVHYTRSNQATPASLARCGHSNFGSAR
jgi:hypothetical protein